MIGGENVCIGCACTETEPCTVETFRGAVPCRWLLVDLTAGRGVCNACPEHLQRFIAGDREIATEMPA